MHILFQFNNFHNALLQIEIYIAAMVWSVKICINYKNLLTLYSPKNNYHFLKIFKCTFIFDLVKLKNHLDSYLFE